MKQQQVKFSNCTNNSGQKRQLSQDFLEENLGLNLSEEAKEEGGAERKRARNASNDGEELNKTRRKLYVHALHTMRLSDSQMDDATVAAAVKDGFMSSNNLFGASADDWECAEKIASTLGSSEESTKTQKSYITHVGYGPPVSQSQFLYKIGHTTDLKQRARSTKTMVLVHKHIQIVQAPRFCAQDSLTKFEDALHFCLDRYRSKERTGGTELFYGYVNGETADPINHFKRMQKLLARIIDLLAQETDHNATAAEIGERIAAGIIVDANGSLYFPFREGDGDGDGGVGVGGGGVGDGVGKQPRIILNRKNVALSRGYKEVKKEGERMDWGELLEWLHTRGYWLELTHEMEEKFNRENHKCSLNEKWKYLQAKIRRDKDFEKLLLEREIEQADADDRRDALELATSTTTTTTTAAAAAAAASTDDDDVVFIGEETATKEPVINTKPVIDLT